MSFYLYLFCGAAGGLLGGMGMGGGTALIPLLTLFCGVEQRAAQGVNLLSFLPMSAAALFVHQRDGLLKREGAVSFALPALVTSFAFSLLAARLPSLVLRTGFGCFLMILGIFRLGKSIFALKNNKNTKTL